MIGDMAVQDEVWSAWLEFNRSRQMYPERGGLLHWIGAAAAAHPDRPAVEADGEVLTYRELDVRSDEVSAFLASSGLSPGDIVAIVSSRTVHPYVGILGILKAGCGYVPIDPSDPSDRLAFILEDAEATAVLAASAQVSLLGWIPKTVTVRGVLDGAETAESPWVPVTGFPSSGAPGRAAYDPDRTCYVIYTSGTTGRPKGVRTSEHSLLNFVHWFLSRHTVLAADRLCQNAPLTFDPSVQQIFPAWAAGACLVTLPEAETRNPFAMLSWLRRQRISHLDVVTAHWHHLREAAEEDDSLRDLPDLRWIIIGGETLHYHHSHQWHRIIRSPALLNNIYGPTEATVNATEVVIDPELTAGQIPIGVPLPNYRLYVVDEAGGLCPPEEIGELLIAGDGLAQRYQSDVATLKAFGELTLPNGHVERVYRSGDLARLITVPDGAWMLEFRGRTDNQVKIRGFRIELEDVESVAKACPGIGDAAVLVRGTPPDQLVCCYTSDSRLPTWSVKDYLAGRLAAFQIPNLFVWLDALPLTRNGKLDRRALAGLVEHELASRRPVGRPPESEPEKLVAQVWADVLAIPRIGVDDDFFTLGGTSLLAMTVVRRLRAQGMLVDPATVFEYPTVGQLAVRCTPATA